MHGKRTTALILSGASAAAAAVLALAGPSFAIDPADCDDAGNVIEGTDGPDVLLGTPGRDVIHGKGGDDVIRGKGGDDTIYGGRGHDTLFGGRGEDCVYGGRGRDDMDGASEGGEGTDDEDLLDGEAGSDEGYYDETGEWGEMYIGKYRYGG